MTEQAGSWSVARTPADLGHFFSQCRVAQGWTQRELSERLGFSQRYLHEIETGKDTRAYTRLFALARALDVEILLRTGESVGPDLGRRPGVEEQIEDWDF
jgi:HTH-type transcriptional regulator / antitoxin HipB